MSKSDDEKGVLQSQGGLGTLAGGASIPSDFMDRMTTTINPPELSSMPSDIRDDYAGASVVEAVGKMPSISDRFGPGGMTTLTGGNFVGSDFGNLGIGMGDMGNFDPTGGLDPSLPQFQQEKTFGQKAGETIKNFLKRLVEMLPCNLQPAIFFWKCQLLLMLHLWQVQLQLCQILVSSQGEKTINLYPTKLNL